MRSFVILEVSLLEERTGEEQEAGKESVLNKERVSSSVFTRFNNCNQ